MVRTDGGVLSMVLLFLCLALCGCGGSDATTTAAPTPAPKPAPIIPEAAWLRYKTAFKENWWEDLELLDKDSYKGQQVIVCWINSQEQELCSQQNYPTAHLFNRTTRPVVHSEEFDEHPTLPNDFRVATLVWEAKWKHSTGVVSDSFGVDVLVFERLTDPTTGGEDWLVRYHAQVVDSKPRPRAPGRPVTSCDAGGPSGWERKLCEKDLNGTLALFKDNAVIRSYDNENVSLNGLFAKDQLATFFDAAELFTSPFPGVGENGLRQQWNSIGLRGGVDFLTGPDNNNDAKFPRRFVSVIFRDDEGPEIIYQYLARWTWEVEEVADRATWHVEHI